MHIKQIIMSDFKSYKEQNSFESFSPQVNCIVGDNGSGKTVFFHAIRFVLSDLFRNLPKEDRQALIHKSAMPTFVEIVFEISDNPIPEEACLRRTIDSEKDEYTYDGRPITKPEVMKFLERVGFSRSNSYYDVPQGKIASLTSMKDSECLDLLNEIGGTQFYEDKKCESQKIMQEIVNRRKQITEVVQYFDETLKELNEEKNELNAYQLLDEKRKFLEYTLYKNKLSKVEEDLIVVTEKLAHSVPDTPEKSKNSEKNYKELTKDLKGLNKRREELQKLCSKAMVKCFKLDLDHEDLKNKISSKKKDKQVAEKQLKILQEEINDLNKKLERITNQVIQEDEISRGIMECEKEINLLDLKRCTDIFGEDANDKSLEKEFDDPVPDNCSNVDQETILREEIPVLNIEREQGKANIGSKIKELESCISQFSASCTYNKGNRDQLQEEWKSLWAEESELLHEVDELKAEKIGAHESFVLAIPKDIRNELNSIQMVANEYDISGYSGPLYQLLDCDEKFFTAVEVTAGNSLFHVVVSTDEVSSEIKSRTTCSQVVFIVLNSEHGPSVNVPQSNDGTPLLDKLTFKDMHKSALSQVFGRTLICKDLAEATTVARTKGFDCITLEGDKVSKEGVMTGGFYDYRRSKLKYNEMVKKKEQVITLKDTMLKNVQIKLEGKANKITELVTEWQVENAKQARNRSEMEQLKQDLANAMKQKQSISEKKETMLLETQSQSQSQISQLEDTVNMKQNEKGKEQLSDHLSPEGTGCSLSQLNTKLIQLKEELSSRDHMKHQLEKAEFETNLAVNLIMRKQELETIISSLTDTGTLEDEAVCNELNDAKLAHQWLTQQLKEISVIIFEKMTQLEKIKDERIELKTLEDNCERILLVEKKYQLLSKRKMILSTKKICDLPPSSSDDFERYKTCSLSDLHKELQECNKILQETSPVNKKAPDQYVNITEEREKLLKKLTELDADKEEIHKLIQELDKQKDKSIVRTYKGVRKHFREVFSELVHGGKGYLVMKKGNDSGDVEGRVENYTGVKVKVSFSEQREPQSMRKLSVGEKTVVALSLIFAILRCDPAPVYLFDEIDVHLDPLQRTAVGKMIRLLADKQNSQIIISSTFGEELMDVADIIYRVTKTNGASNVEVVSKENASNNLPLPA